MAVAAFHEFETPQDLATRLAQDICEHLSATLAQSSTASLAVSGGRTPGLLFDTLSRQALNWQDISITLVDDRDVNADHPRSNEKFVRERLLVNEAATARFVPLRGVDDRDIPQPLDVAILGMGEDGHTASFFSGGDHLDEATDPTGQRMILPMKAPSAGEARLTLTLPVIAEAKRLILHIEGEAKRRTLEKALHEGPSHEMPIRHVLCHPSAELETYWAP